MENAPADPADERQSDPVADPVDKPEGDAPTPDEVVERHNEGEVQGDQVQGDKVVNEEPDAA